MGRETTVDLIAKHNTVRMSRRGAAVCLMSVIAASTMLGCEVDSFFDPSKTGYFEFTPTTMPILERLDVVERGAEQWEGAEAPTRSDLVPTQLEYRLVPGDVVDVEIWELYAPQTPARTQARIDQSGNIRLPMPLRDVPAAGLTLQELEDDIVRRLDPVILRDPLVNLVLVQGQGFHYTVTGSVPGPSIYPLNRPDLRIADALALAGGVPAFVQNIYVVREVALSSEYDPAYEDRPTPPPAQGDQDDRTNVDDLIDQLGDDANNNGDGGGISPGALKKDGEELLDVDDFQPRLISQDPPIDIDSVNNAGSGSPAGGNDMDSWVFVEERGEWVRTRGGQPNQDVVDVDDLEQPLGDRLVTERIIRIPAKSLNSDSRYNIVIRPSDRIIVEQPTTGVVYIGGEVLRPGVYSLPTNGRLSLDQLVTAAGGPGPLAIPERVDFTRRLEGNRQATLRVNLRAIRQRTEPDIFIKPDDHIVIGTNWVAAPLAVIRNGFRATYGFGFLLDRNFGNDVFGAPPSNFQN